jgi:predicted metal-dependent enzyme (double-stranded beta helix superfamily)
MSMTEEMIPALATMTDEIRTFVTQGLSEAETGEEVASVVSDYVNKEILLKPEYRVGDPERYKQHILHVEPDGSFSIVSLVWLPGQETAIHDHVSWCVVGVHEGEESEERFSVVEANGESHLRLEGTVTNPEGLVVWLSPPGDIHRVTNTDQKTTISIHVYGADISVLGTSIRREYELPIKA